MAKAICGLVRDYEDIIQRTKPARTELVERNVLESERILAKHLPLCPVPAEQSLLPRDNIDCVACTLEYDVTAWSQACYVLRIQGNAGFITAEVYLSTISKGIDRVAMPFKYAGHVLKYIGTGRPTSEYKDRRVEEQESAKEKGVRILHFIENALDLATSALLQESAQAKIDSIKKAKAAPKQATILDENMGGTGSSEKVIKKIKRRGDEQ